MALSACASLDASSPDANIATVTNIAIAPDTKAQQLRNLGFLHHRKHRFRRAIDEYSKAIGLVDRI